MAWKEVVPVGEKLALAWSPDLIEPAKQRYRSSLLSIPGMDSDECFVDEERIDWNKVVASKYDTVERKNTYLHMVSNMGSSQSDE